jgi:WD40 repeat protein
MLWDLTSTRSLIKEPTATFYGHVADVGAIDTWRDDINTFVSGSQDGFAKLWDIRVPVTPHSRPRRHVDRRPHTPRFPHVLLHSYLILRWATAVY